MDASSSLNFTIHCCTFSFSASREAEKQTAAMLWVVYLWTGSGSLQQLSQPVSALALICCI